MSKTRIERRSEEAHNVIAGGWYRFCRRPADEDRDNSALSTPNGGFPSAVALGSWHLVVGTRYPTRKLRDDAHVLVGAIHDRLVPAAADLDDVLVPEM